MCNAVREFRVLRQLNFSFAFSSLLVRENSLWSVFRQMKSAGLQLD